MQGSESFLAEFDTIRFAWCYRTWYGNFFVSKTGKIE